MPTQPAATQPNPAEVQQAQLARAFLNVFGVPHERTPSQKSVMECLAGLCHATKPLVQVIGGGGVDTVATSINAARFELFRFIEIKVNQALNPVEPKEIPVKSGLRQEQPNA
jgi:hypothetical protein